MEFSRHEVFFTVQPGRVRDELWVEEARARARELGFEVRLNEQTGRLSEADWADALAGVEFLMTTWGAPQLNARTLAKNSCLRIVGHAAGSVANIVSDDLYDRGVNVVTANWVMARSVAEWSLMMTLVACRGLLSYASFGGHRQPVAAARHTGRSLREQCIGIWGYGDVARWLIDMLLPLAPRRVLVCDAFLDAEEARAKGVEKVAFERLFAEADIVHVLTGLTRCNVGRVDAAALASMPEGATLINAGRPPLVDRQALLEAVRSGRIQAILDVHYREPVPADDPFLAFPNVLMTPHCAGYPGRGGYVPLILEEFDRFSRGEPLQHEVTRRRAASMTDQTLLRSS